MQRRWANCWVYWQKAPVQSHFFSQQRHCKGARDSGSSCVPDIRRSSTSRRTSTTMCAWIGRSARAIAAFCHCCSRAGTCKPRAWWLRTKKLQSPGCRGVGLWPDGSLPKTNSHTNSLESHFFLKLRSAYSY